MAIPADHQTTAKQLGTLGMLKIIAKAGWNYRHTMVYLLGKRQFKRFNNFLYTKTLVPTGEGSGELAYYFIGGFLQKHPQFVPFPKYIEVEITSVCNKLCRICEHTSWDMPSRHLTFENFKNLVDQFDLKWINATGEGDAFLNPDYLKMIQYLKKRNTSVYLVDSFDLITKDVARVLVESGVDGIYISMDGATKETYESIKIGCNYDKVLTNIKNLLEIKKELNSPIPEICFRFVVNKKNVHEMADYVKIINSLADRKLWGDGSKIHFVGLLDFPEIHDLYLETIPIDKIQETIEISTSNPKWMPVVFAHTEEKTNPSINTCLAWAEPYFALVPEPMMLPCCAVLMSNNRNHLLEYSFGNYTEESIKDIWNHPYYKWFRQTVTNPKAKVPMLCVGCRAYDTAERIRLNGMDIRERSDFE